MRGLLWGYAHAGLHPAGRRHVNKAARPQETMHEANAPTGPPLTLTAAERDCWQRLEQAAAGHGPRPFRTPTLGTTNGAGGVALRTVVLRGADATARTLCCFTDRRAAKVAALSHHPHASWLFWDPDGGLQLRLSGSTTLHHHDALADQHWQRIPPARRKDYLGSVPPATPLPHPSDGLPPHLKGDHLTEANTAAGRDNFTVIVTQVDHVDWLLLARTGHRRAQFRYRDGQTDQRWVAP